MMAASKKTSRKIVKRTRTSQKTTRKQAAPKAPGARALGKPGTYTVPRGHVTIAVPTFWTLRQTNDDLEIEAPSDTTSVIVTAFKQDKTTGPLDARDFLQRFMRTAPANGRSKLEPGTRQRASARFRDPEGDHWRVMFLSNGKTLLLATCNTSAPLISREARTGTQVLDSLKLKPRE
jgi:hypothetical protein